MLNRIARGKGLISPVANGNGKTPKNVLVLTPGRIPTTDIYFKGRLEKRFNGNVHYMNTLATSPRSIVREETALIIVVRYAPLRWLRWLSRIHDQVSGVIFFTDDDMPMAMQAPELPLGYAIKTAMRYALTKRVIGGGCSEGWLSTPVLAKRYPNVSTRVKTPGYVFPEQPDRVQDVYFYHGTWAHRWEIKWLLPIVKKVQQNQQGVWFEIMGDDRVRRLFRGVPRVRIVHPMPWLDYLNYAAMCRYQIGLAPCLETDFNKGRSHTKMFDITRMGAAGIYSKGVPYEGNVNHGRTGLLCDNEPDAWVVAILLLLRDQVLREKIAENAGKYCEKCTL